MRKRIISALLVLGMLLGMLSACAGNSGLSSKSAQKRIQLTWEKKVRPIKILQSIGQNGKPSYFQSATYDNVTYSIAEETFKEKSAKIFIERISGLISYADTVFEKERDGEELFLNKTVEGKYINIEEDISFDTLWSGLNRIYKMSGLEQYGLFYLYSVNNKQISGEQIDEEQLGKYFSDGENQFLLDFCVPMIDARIFGEEQVEMTKAAAKSFAMWYVNQHSLKDYEKLCKNLETFDRKELEKEKNNWLETIGCKTKYTESYKVFVKPTDCVYEESMKVYDPADYEIEEEDAIWVWYSKDIKRIGWQEMLRKYKEYEPLRRRDFAEAREFLKDYLPENVGKAKIVLDYHHQKGTNGVTEPTTLMIKTNRCWENTAICLLHEYIHYLTLGKEKIIESCENLFCMEGVATWISSFQLENQEYELGRQYMADAYNKERVDGKKWEANMLDFDKAYSLYQEFCYGLQEKTMRDSSRKAKKGVPYPVDINRMYYAEYGCILKYVYETYGMEKTMELLKSKGNFEKVLGKTLDELYFETADFVKEEMQKMEAANNEKTSN